MSELSLRQKSMMDLVGRVAPLKKIIKEWFYHAGMEFLRNRQLSDEEEVFLEEVTDFFVENLDGIEENKAYLERGKLEPIKLPVKKKIKL